MPSRKRMRVFIASISASALCIASVAIIAYCLRYTRELEAQENASSLPPNFIPVDSAAETKKDNSQEIAEFQSRLDLYYDDMEETTWIYAKGQEKEISDFTCYTYIGNREDHYWLRLKFGFRQSDWLFMQAIKMKCGEETFEYVLDYSDRRSDVGYGGTVYEWFDIALTNSQIDALRHMCSLGDETKVRCYGDTYAEDFILTDSQKASIVTILDYYELVKE